MLTALSIRNIILIDKLDLRFGSGLCVLTGETGAGKSILLDALGFALGGRGSTRLLRHGQKQGSATAVFDVSAKPSICQILEGQGIEASDELFLRRVIYEDGKSRAFVNDSPVSAGFLAQVAEQLIEVHGQHDQKGLLDAATNRSILDQFGKLEPQVQKTKDAFYAYRELAEELESLLNSKNNAAAEQDYLRHVVNELELLNVQAGEEETLDSRRKVLMNKEKLIEAVNAASSILSGDVTLDDRIREAQGVLLRNAAFCDAFSEVVETLERSALELNEALGALEQSLTDIDEGEESLEATEERLFALRAASRKYNTSVDELPAYCEKMQQKLDLVSNQEQRTGELEKQVQQARQAYVQYASELSKARGEAALRMREALHKELVPLKMENTRFEVVLETLMEPLWSPFGVDKVQFMVATNPGAPLAALAKIASGGELSRFMLAMKVVLQETKSVPCMIFDEVDTGIGGAVADAVGKRLEMLGQKVQVLVITHQPQVAARGGYHLKVTKTQGKEATSTSVAVLSENERKEELARMLSGAQVTEQALAAAESLLGA